jgi:hypothetical protein
MWASPTVEALTLVELVAVEEEARASLESRYFDGRPVLLGDAAQEWAGLRDMVDRLASLAGVRPPVIGARTSGHRRSTAAAGRRHRADRVQERARTHADDARDSTFEQLGDRRRALAILERRLCDASHRHHDHLVSAHDIAAQPVANAYVLVTDGTPAGDLRACPRLWLG